MRKQNTSSVKAHIVRGAFYLALLSTGILLGFFRPETPAKSSQRTLTFNERVTYQRAIEEVYWRHRIWPKENSKPKPSLDAVISHAELEEKVKDYLYKSELITVQRGLPITAVELQAEIDHMTQHTKAPDMLGELFEALGNDPVVIAECLGRPVLAERTLATNASLKEQLQTRRSRAGKQTTKAVGALGSSYILPQDRSPFGFTFNFLNTGGRYNPNANSWTPTSTTNAPDRRTGHTAVWTGSEMIVWGGDDVNALSLNTGGRYNPTTDSWTATSIVSAPDARGGHTAVWTGTEMIVWGGLFFDGSNYHYLNTGGRYNPTTDSWTATSNVSAPNARDGHTAVWTGGEMIVWGGADLSTYFNTGGKYNPGTDNWTATSIVSAPDARDGHTAVWTGAEMIVWGGRNNISPYYLNTGGKYNPGTDSWTVTSTTGAPTGRAFHTAVWSAGNEMIVWGGQVSITFDTNTGGRYNPNADSWTPANNGYQPRIYHTAIWTGSEMIVWGGTNINTGGEYLNDGLRYNPGTDSWTATSITNAPTARYGHTAVWTGSEMIVWGGRGEPTPTPTATPTATATATVTASGTPTASPSATCSCSPPRSTPTPRPRPTPAPRPTP
jgi:N-acetylneuraminic acid mutarotase